MFQVAFGKPLDCRLVETNAVLDLIGRLQLGGSCNAQGVQSSTVPLLPCDRSFEPQARLRRPWMNPNGDRIHWSLKGEGLTVTARNA